MRRFLSDRIGDPRAHTETCLSLPSERIESSVPVLSRNSLSEPSIFTVPEEIIVLILCEVLLPKDLLSVGQTCRWLRSLSFDRTAWKLANARERARPKLSLSPLFLNRVPNLHPTRLVHHGEHDVNQLLSIEPLSTTVSSIPTAVLNLDGSLHPRDEYLNSLRRKYPINQSSQPTKLVLRPQAFTIEGIFWDSFHTLKLNAAGDTLGVVMTDRIMVVDFQEGRKYTLQKNTTPGDLSYTEILIERFEYMSCYGALLVLTLYDKHTIELVFQPFGPENPDPQLLGTLQAPGANWFFNSWLSASYLITGESTLGSVVLRVCNLATGEVKEMSPVPWSERPLIAEVYNDEVLAYTLHSDFSGIIMIDIESRQRLGFVRVPSDYPPSILLPPAALAKASKGSKDVIDVWWTEKMRGIEAFSVANVSFRTRKVLEETISGPSTLHNDVLPPAKAPSVPAGSPTGGRSSALFSLMKQLSPWRTASRPFRASENHPGAHHILSLLRPTNHDDFAGMVLGQRGREGAVAHAPLYVFDGPMQALADEGFKQEPIRLTWNAEQSVLVQWSEIADRVVVYSSEPGNLEIFSLKVYELSTWSN